MVAPKRFCRSTHTITVVKHKNATSQGSCQGESSPRPAPRQDSYVKSSLRMSGRTPRDRVVHPVVYTTSHSGKGVFCPTPQQGLLRRLAREVLRDGSLGEGR